MDIDPPILNYVKINGFLTFDRSKAKSVLQAKYIWVNQGKIIAGSPEEPYQNQIDIILHG